MQSTGLVMAGPLATLQSGMFANHLCWAMIEKTELFATPHSCATPVGWLCRAVSSRRLVPGDVLVLLRGKATCDMVLLRGNCLVEESMLSGEVLNSAY